MHSLLNITRTGTWYLSELFEEIAMPRCGSAALFEKQGVSHTDRTPCGHTLRSLLDICQIDLRHQTQLGQAGRMERQYPSLPICPR